MYTWNEVYVKWVINFDMKWTFKILYGIWDFYICIIKMILTVGCMLVCCLTEYGTHGLQVVVDYFQRKIGT